MKSFVKPLLKSLLLLSVVATTAGASTHRSPLIRDTLSGPIRGREDSTTYTFLGVPFAAAPVKEKRFTAPEPVKSWKTIRETTAYGNDCVQKSLNPLKSNSIGSEDCLFLNIWVPKSLGSEENVKVLFYIPGGAFVLGSANFDLGLGNVYDGSSLAETQRAIVVSVNYRLGSLGFLSHPALTEKSRHHASGNYGILDQIAALNWVKNNIEEFNGNANNVTIFGESAGGVSVCALLVSPLASGLFHKAIMESGFCNFSTLAVQESRGLESSNKLSCDKKEDVVACLQKKTADEVVKSDGDILGKLQDLKYDPKHVVNLPIAPTIDGYVIPDEPLKLIKSGQYNKVPILLGSNKTEGALFVNPGKILTCNKYESYLKEKFGSTAKQIIKQYPCRGIYKETGIIDIFTDFTFSCPTRTYMRAFSENQSDGVYRYFFTKLSLSPAWILGPSHGAELTYVFNTFITMAIVPTPAAKDLSEKIQNYWGSFAETGNPNSGSNVYWPEFKTDQEKYLTLNDEITADSKLSEANCNFWEKWAKQK